MHFLGKIILGLSSATLLLAVIIFVSVYFTRKTKDQTLSTGSLSDTTISSTMNTDNSNIMSIQSSVTADTMIEITTSSNPNIITSPSKVTSENMIESTSTSSASSTLMFIPGGSSTINSGSSSANPSNGMSTGTTKTVTVSTVSYGSTHVSKITTNTVTSTSSACSFGLEPMDPYITDGLLGPVAVAVGYFNADSFLDVIVANYDGQSVGILLGNGDGTFSDENIFFVGNNTGLVAIAVGDFNNDQKLDAVILSIYSANMVVLLGNGDGTLRVQKAISIGSRSNPAAAAVVVGYFNQDNILDLAFANSGSGRVLIYTGNGNGTFQSQKSLQAGGNSVPNGVAVGDFNHDNNTDVVAADWGTNLVSVFLGYGNGSFRSSMTFPTGNQPTWINVADFNGDNNLDIAVLNNGDNTIGILLGIGNGTFGAQTTYSVLNANDTYFFAIADVNNDVLWDLVIPNTDNDNMGIFLGRGDGSFRAQILFSTGENSAPTGLAVADFNGDNRSDIVVANYGTKEVEVFLGTC